MPKLQRISKLFAPLGNRQKISKLRYSFNNEYQYIEFMLLGSAFKMVCQNNFKNEYQYIKFRAMLLGSAFEMVCQNDLSFWEIDKEYQNQGAA